MPTLPNADKTILSSVLTLPVTSTFKIRPEKCINGTIAMTMPIKHPNRFSPLFTLETIPNFSTVISQLKRRNVFCVLSLSFSLTKKDIFFASIRLSDFIAMFFRERLLKTASWL